MTNARHAAYMCRPVAGTINACLLFVIYAMKIIANVVYESFMCTRLLGA